MIMENVNKRIISKKRGWCFTPKDLLDLGSPTAIWQTLHRLEQKGTIRRILRGVYEYPKESQFMEGYATPNPDCVAQAIARSNQWTIVPEGNTALNIIGLSTQVPARWQYLTDGPTRLYSLNSITLRFIHRAIKETAGLSYDSAVMTQAIKSLGKEHIDKDIILRLHSLRSPKEWEIVLKECRYITSWIYEVMKAAANEEIEHV